MPHDHHSHSHGHSHAHSHSHGHGHSHAHQHATTGHNHDGAAPMHLHSHMLPEDEAVEVGMLCEQFIEGFKAASDKASFLRLSGVPFEMQSRTGGKALKLVDVTVETGWQVGAASPAFGGGDLSYHPFPGPMIRERTNCKLVYVSLTERHDRDLRDFMAEKRMIAEKMAGTAS